MKMNSSRADGASHGCEIFGVARYFIRMTGIVNLFHALARRATYELPVASATGEYEAEIESPEGDTIRPSVAMKC